MNLAFQFLITVQSYVMEMLCSVVYVAISRMSVESAFAERDILVSSSILWICLAEYV